MRTARRPRAPRQKPAAVVIAMATYDDGSIPHGQFFHEKEDHIALGLHLGLQP